MKTLILYPEQPSLCFLLLLSVESEQAQFCDLVQFDFVDHYNNITLKTVHILKFLLDHPTLSKSLQYALFTDDDSFVNVPKLYEELFIKRVGSPLVQIPIFSNIKKQMQKMRGSSGKALAVKRDPTQLLCIAR